MISRVKENFSNFKKTDEGEKLIDWMPMPLWLFFLLWFVLLALGIIETNVSISFAPENSIVKAGISAMIKGFVFFSLLEWFAVARIIFGWFNFYQKNR